MESLRARIEAVEPKIEAYLSIDFEAAAKDGWNRTLAWFEAHMAVAT